MIIFSREINQKWFSVFYLDVNFVLADATRNLKEFWHLAISVCGGWGRSGEGATAPLGL